MNAAVDAATVAAATNSAECAPVTAVEVSSTSYYLDDDLETAVANAIFADGAGAMILAGADTISAGGGPEVIAHRTLVRPEFLQTIEEHWSKQTLVRNQLVNR